MTVAIGVLCERGACIVVGTESRASYRTTRPNDSCGKTFDFPPHPLIISIASVVSECQSLVSQLTVEIEKLTPPVYIDHMVDALIEARYYIQRRRVRLDLMDQLNITLTEYKRVRLDPALRKRAEEIIRAFKLNAHVLIAGFIDKTLMFFRMIGDAYPEEESSPGVFVIGTPKASQAAQELLSKRGQNNEYSLARSVVHVVQALQAARKSEHGDYIGPDAGYFVIRNDDRGILRIQAGDPLLKQWLKEYRKDTAPLDRSEFREQVNKILLTQSDVQRLADQQ